MDDKKLNAAAEKLHKDYVKQLILTDLRGAPYYSTVESEFEKGCRLLLPKLIESAQSREAEILKLEADKKILRDKNEQLTVIVKMVKESIEETGPTLFNTIHKMCVEALQQTGGGNGK